MGRRNSREGYRTLSYYVIRSQDGKILHWHVDHVKKRVIFIMVIGPSSYIRLTYDQFSNRPSNESEHVDQQNESEPADSSEPVVSTKPCCSGQVRNPPDYFSQCVISLTWRKCNNVNWTYLIILFSFCVYSVINFNYWLCHFLSWVLILCKHACTISCAVFF